MRNRTEATKILLDAGWTIEEIETVIPRSATPSATPYWISQQHIDMRIPFDAGVVRQKHLASLALERLERRSQIDVTTWASGIAQDVCNATD